MRCHKACATSLHDFVPRIPSRTPHHTTPLRLALAWFRLPLERLPSVAWPLVPPGPAHRARHRDEGLVLLGWDGGHPLRLVAHPAVGEERQLRVTASRPRAGHYIGVCAGSSEVQAVPCGLQNSVWDIPWLGLASSWTPGTGPIAAMAPSRKCLEASVKTGQLSLRSCSNSSAEQNFSFVLVKGCQFGDCDYSDSWPKPWEPNSFGIASVH